MTGYHYHFPSFSHVMMDGSRWKMATWQPGNLSVRPGFCTTFGKQSVLGCQGPNSIRVSQSHFVEIQQCSFHFDSGSQAATNFNLLT